MRELEDFLRQERKGAPTEPPRQRRGGAGRSPVIPRRCAHGQASPHPWRQRCKSPGVVA